MSFLASRPSRSIRLRMPPRHITADLARSRHSERTSLPGCFDSGDRHRDGGGGGSRERQADHADPEWLGSTCSDGRGRRCTHRSHSAIFYGSAAAVALEVKLETVDVGGVPIRLTAVPDTGSSFQKPKRGTLRQRVELGTLRGLEDRSASFEFRNVQLPYLIGSGLESMWVTAAAP